MGSPGRETTAVRALARLARLFERSCAEGGLTLPQYRVLLNVAAGDERASLLAGRLALAKPTVTAVVDGLVERGWLCRSAVAGDRRAARINVTAAGRRALRSSEAAMVDRLDSLIRRTTDPVMVLGALAQLGQALDEATAERASRALAAPSGR